MFIFSRGAHSLLMWKIVIGVVFDPGEFIRRGLCDRPDHVPVVRRLWSVVVVCIQLRI